MLVLQNLPVLPGELLLPSLPPSFIYVKGLQRPAPRRYPDLTLLQSPPSNPTSSTPTKLPLGLLPPLQFEDLEQSGDCSLLPGKPSCPSLQTCLSVPGPLATSSKHIFSSLGLYLLMFPTPNSSFSLSSKRLPL